MRHGSLFSGIGGFDLAARWMGWENVFHVEKDGFCRKVLAKNFPESAAYEDIKEFDGRQYRGKVDIISGGFPCQPFSTAGKRKGAADDRYLWPEMLRIIREVQPDWIVGENVAGIISMDSGSIFEQIHLDLEGEGYAVQAFSIPACSKGAPHKRERYWFVAHATSKLRRTKNSTRLGMEGYAFQEIGRDESSVRCEVCYRDASNPDYKGLPIPICTKFGSFQEKNGTSEGGEPCRKISTPEQWGEHWLPVATRICRMDDGIPRRMDRARRLKALGNAIVPQVAYEIFKAINNH